MRPVTLTAVKGGLSRLRTKGAASKDSLHTLTNGHVTKARTIVGRPGTVRISTLTAGTKGLAAYNGKLHVFSSASVAGLSDDFVLNILKHPSSNTPTLSKIHFAVPFLGFLYVVAEFSDALIVHYWLQSAEEWEADTVYSANQLVQATTDNGFVFRATRLGGAFPAWLPDVPRALNDLCEPTTYNDLYFKVTKVIGDNPRSGAEEPVWPTEPGAIVIEDTDSGVSEPPPDPVGVAPPTTIPQPTDTRDRYRRPRRGFSRPQ